MRGWLYLIRNRDLYKIGITKNFDNRMRQLKPDNVIIKLYTKDFLKLERELHNRYKKYRIPQTEYFRLKDYHLKEIKASPNEIRSIQKSDKDIAIFKSLIYKDITTNVRKNVNNNNNIDFIQIPKVKIKG